MMVVSYELKILVVDRTGTLTDMVTAQLPIDKIVCARAETVVQVAELMTTELYAILILDLDQNIESIGPLFDMLGHMEEAPSVILIAEAKTDRLRQTEETALAHSVNILARLDRPIKKEDLILALEGSSLSAQTINDGSAILAESEFLRGLMSNGLSPIFQPKIHIRSRKLVEANSYARWKTVSGGLLGASAIIKLARLQGHMEIFTSRMLELGFQQHMFWAKKGIDVRIAVTINGESLDQESFLDILIGLAEQYETPPEKIRLMIFEADLALLPGNPAKVLHAIKDHGFFLGLNDFGTGFSTLLEHSDIPFDEIIISRRFTRQIAETRRARIILESAIDLAQKLGMTVTCEGVETVDQLALVAALGADCAQGYLIGKPMLSSRFYDWAEGFSTKKITIPGLA